MNHAITLYIENTTERRYTIQPKPRVSFLFPYRWLNDDREYLEDNLRRQFIKDWGDVHLYELEGIPAYRITVIYYHREPIDIPLTKTFIQKAFRKLFPIGRCLGVNTDFVQKKSKTMLPVLDFQVYF